ncbi:MAG: glycoside hydrolase family 3 C-terminal domain-containing protein [Alphaproteobacteria bacterium]
MTRKSQTKNVLTSAQSLTKLVTDLLSQLTLDEKISLMSGADMWSTPSIERVGIPKLKMTDGPNGARGIFGSKTSAACFPVGVAMAATWNPDLIKNIGVALGEEAKTKGAQVLLGPTINLQRTPIGGRNFECFSEDPVLSGDLAVSYIHGVQSQGVAACPKHYIANDTEFERHTISSNVDDRSLRELYLYPFEMAVTKGNAWTMMSAYNKVNGTYASSHDELVNGVLRTEWDFDGLLVSDWGAALETVENANGGIDLEMPGPPRSWGDNLRKAVDSGEVSLDVIDQHVGRLIRLASRVGAIDETPDYTEYSVDTPEHRLLARQAATESMVLIKNDGEVLPLAKEKVTSLAVIGPNAKVSQIQGGGSSSLLPHYTVNALDGLLAGFYNSDIKFEPGCLTHKYLPAFDTDKIKSKNGELGGFTSLRYNTLDFSGDPDVSHETRSRIFLFDAIGVTGAADPISIRLLASYTPEKNGLHSFGLASAGLARLYIDDKEIVDNWTEQDSGDSFFGFGTAEKVGTLALEAGQSYAIRIDYVRPSDAMIGGIRFGTLPPVENNLIQSAVTAAKNAENTILVLGSNADWESEGTDRTTMDLPGQQNALAEAVLSANPNTIVVMNAGAPMNLPWFDKVKSLLWVWFPGQEFGNALFDVITGISDPSGRSPISFPKQLKDHPAYAHYPGTDGQMDYKEKLFMGYRHYDLEATPDPLVSFGHGLSYADIELQSLAGPDSFQVGSTVSLNVTVRNHSNRAGFVVAQLYIRPLEPAVTRPIKELKAFKKLKVAGHSSETLKFDLPSRAFAYWDVDGGCWRCDDGAYEVLIGNSATDIVLSKTISLTS